MDPEFIPAKAKPARRRLPWFVHFLMAVIVIFLLFEFALGPIGPGPRRQAAMVVGQQTRTIGLAMFQYAVDHQQYPDGKSSTEVFQKLIDGGYLTDPAIFYVRLAGKTEALPGHKLQPENVSFDATSGVGSKPADGLPLVFLTGYRIAYQPGGAAVSLVKPYPRFNEPGWLEGWKYHELPSDIIIAVCYGNNNAANKHVAVGADGYGFVANFVPATLDAQGKTYRQLTPDGLLGP